MNPVKADGKHLPGRTVRPDVSPSRRELLRTCGPALSLAVGLSGCLSSVPFVGGPPKVREESGQTVERAIHTPLTDETADPAFATLVVGERGFHLGEKKPHQVWVRNGTEKSRDLLVEVGPTADADPWFRRNYDFAPGARLAVELRTPREYAISVEAADAGETIEVAESRFDCNDSAHDVVVRNGEIETVGVATDQGCSIF